MEVKEIHTEYEDECNKIEIFVNGKKMFYVIDGEPEDRLLCRDFSDCYEITTLMQLAYNAGKNGEEFILTCEEY